MLHVGAQGDKPFSLAYFREKGLDISSVDSEKSTPLHWACIQSSFITINYLLAWGADINGQDKAGYTPLHLAVKAALSNKTDYLVIKLIMKGADKNIEDTLGRKPIDLIEKEHFEN